MKDTSKKALRRGHNEGNIRRRTDGRWEVRLSAGIDYKTGKPRRTSTCCNTRQEAIAILQQQAHEVRTQGWRDPMSVTLGEWYEYWLDTYMKDTVKQSTYASYRSYLNKHFCVLRKILLKKLEPHTLQEFYNYKFREEGLSPKTLRNYHMALHKCLQQAVKEHLLVYNPCDAVTLPSGEKPEISVFTNDQQRVLVQTSYRHRYGVFIRLDLCTGLRMGDDDDKIRLNQRKPSKYKGLSRFGPEKNLQRINKFMKERPTFYKKLIQMKENFRFYLRCFYCITKVVILQFNSEKQDRISS